VSKTAQPARSEAKPSEALTGEPVLAVRDLECTLRSRGGAFQLRVDDLALRRGEVLVVLGPNGAGKSTLLRALAGLEPGARGRVERAADGATALVFQRPAALAGTVSHNVRAALLGSGLARPEVERRVRLALDRFEIGALAARRAATLSGGELRRLALARAFAQDPAVLLLDEPYDDLDSAGQAAITLDLRRVIADTGVAVALVTHDLRRALLLADRIAVMIGGRIQQQGPRAPMLVRPATCAVARLVGMDNLVAGVAEPDGFARIDEAHRIPLGSIPRAGERGWVGIRPEHLKLDVGRGEGEPIGKGRVASLVDDGLTAHVRVAWANLELRTHLLAGRGLARTLSVGDPVSLSVRADCVHWIPEPEMEDVDARC
jgi:ABC-type sulfate/molybdate transport systems ATPase subunit